MHIYCRIYLDGIGSLIDAVKSGDVPADEADSMINACQAAKNRTKRRDELATACSGIHRGYRAKAPKEVRDNERELLGN